jgi:multisubunit Na+/H+ antiporter MnhB subunit
VAVSGFLAVVAYVVGHDDPAPGLSHRGLLTVALAALVMVLLTIHRRYGSGSLARAAIEYTVVALLATLLAAAGGATIDQPPTDRPTRVEAQAQAAAGDDQPAALRVGATVVRAVTGAARAVAGAVRWLVDLWRRADPQTRPPKGEAMAASPPSPAPSVLSLRRCL